MSICRSCQGEFFGSPILMYPNSPRSAQDFIVNLDDTDDKFVNLEIYQCSQCGLIQHNLDPVNYHKEVIRAVSFSNEMKSFREKQLLGWVSRNNLTEKAILEVGSGRGEYLEIFKSIGVDNIHGLEFGGNNFGKIISSGHNATKGYLDNHLLKIDNAPFDAFAIFSFMEHWPEPSNSLKILNKFINKDAVGLIEVPNFEMIKKKGLYTEFTVDHIFYFDHSNLSLFLRNNGFEIVSMNNIWHDYIISVEVKRRAPLNVDIFKIKYATIKSQLHEYLDSKNSEDNIIWGAGHQALSVISLTNIVDKISYVVDSATFKQGKYTPGSHLLIHDPKYMKKNNPETLIIMAAGFSDEILKIVLSEYDFIKNVAILREDAIEVIK